MTLSQELHLEEGKAKQLPEGPNDQIDDLCSRGPLSWIRDFFFWFAIIIFGIVFVIYFVIVEIVLRQLIKFSIKKKGFLLLCVTAIIMDPLFLYIPVIRDQRQCIKFDESLGIISTFIRSVLDFLKIIHIISLLLHELHEKRKKHLWFFFFLDILAILPIPQVLVNIRKIEGPYFFFLMSTFFLLQYLLRIILSYFLFTQATGVTGILAEETWATVAFNLLLYMLGSHVFGALWYFYAIEKMTSCWKRASIMQIDQCLHHSPFCYDNSGTCSVIDDFCVIDTRNTTKYNFGLYADALESGVVKETNFPKKLLHCLNWGLQNLSAFGQNLKTTMDVRENIFAICMTSFGVVLFVFLIGKMQSDTARSRKIRNKWQEIKKWSNFEKIPSDIQGQLRKYKRKKWRETKRVDVDNLVNDLPEDLGNKIRRELCLKLLKKVKEVENLSEKSLGDLCDCMKPVFVMERTRIIREGDPIDEMLFVLKGKLWTYSSASMTSSTVSHLIDHRNRENLNDDAFFGQELITWAQNERSSNLPVSTRTIQALTNVEAFALIAVDLKHVLLLSHFDRAALLLQCYWRFKRFLYNKRNPPPKLSVKSLWGKCLEKIQSELKPLLK